MSAKRDAQFKDAVPTDDPLCRLRDEFERELAVLRVPGAADQLREIFAVGPQAMADAANAESDDDR